MRKNPITWKVFSFSILSACCVLVILFKPITLCAEKLDIGIILPLTGPASTNGKSLRGIEAVLRPQFLKLHYENDKCDAKFGLAAYRKLRMEGVRIFYVACSGSLLAIAPIAKRNDDLILTTYAGSSHIRNTGSEVIRMNPDAESLAQSMETLLSGPGEKTILLHEEQDYSTSFADYLEKNSSRTIIKRIGYLPDGRSYSPEVLSIKSSDAESILFLPVADGAAKLMLKEIGQYKITAKIIGEVNLCDYPFRPSEFGLHGKCLASGFEGRDYKEFLSSYEKIVGYPSLYPFNDALAYDLFHFLNSISKEKNGKITVELLRANILKGFVGKFAKYKFSENGEIQDVEGYVQVRDF